MICKNVTFILFFSDMLFYILMLDACSGRARHSWIQRIQILCFLLSYFPELRFDM